MSRTSTATEVIWKTMQCVDVQKQCLHQHGPPIAYLAWLGMNVSGRCLVRDWLVSGLLDMRTSMKKQVAMGSCMGRQKAVPAKPAGKGLGLSRPALHSGHIESVSRAKPDTQRPDLKAGSLSERSGASFGREYSFKSVNTCIVGPEVYRCVLQSFPFRPRWQTKLFL